MLTDSTVLGTLGSYHNAIGNRQNCWLTVLMHICKYSIKKTILGFLLCGREVAALRGCSEGNRQKNDRVVLRTVENFSNIKQCRDNAAD